MTDELRDTLQIGTTGESEPMYCGCGCGELVRGRHSVSHSLGNGKFTTYLAKHDYKWVEDHPPQDEPLHTFRKIALPKTAIIAPAKDKKEKDQS